MQDHLWPGSTQLVRLHADLASIVREGKTRNIREGAAYGLGDIGGRDVVTHLLEALRAGKILELAASGILESLLEDEEQLRQLLADEETRVARTGLFILEVRRLREQSKPPSAQTVTAARATLARVTTSPKTRRALDELFAASAAQQ